MKFKTILLSLFVVTGFFCAAQSGTTVSDSIYSGGMYRKFRVYVPAIYNGTSPVPLVFNFHGLSSSALQQQLYGNFMPIADTANFIIVHPDGSYLFGNQFWNTGIVPSPNDVAFTNDLINYLQGEYSIDGSRIYSCGMSNGGIMSYYLACNLPNRITAIASVTGCMFNLWQPSCNPPRAIPVMEIHGTADEIVPYIGSMDFAHTDTTVKKWQRHNNCNPVPTTFSVPNINAGDNSTVVNYRYTGGTDGSSVELYKVTGGSHSWPGAYAIIPNTNQDFNASVEIWRFFRQYRLTQFVTITGIPKNNLSTTVKIYPNPSSDRLTVEGPEGVTISVYTPDGKTCAVKIVGSEVYTGDLPAGLYFLKVTKEGGEKVLKIVKQ